MDYVGPVEQSNVHSDVLIKYVDVQIRLAAKLFIRCTWIGRNRECAVRRHETIS